MANKANKCEVVYVPLDVLLDTRLGTIARVAGDDIALNVLKTGYHARESDLNFEGVDKDAYQAQYKSRDSETLRKSYVTNAASLVMQLVAAITEEATKVPFHDGARVEVNTYPYKLTEEECSELHQAVSVWLGNLVPVNLVHTSLEALTPSHCKDSYGTMFMYDYEEWFLIHQARFKEVRLPEVTMYAPAIYFAGPAPAPEKLEAIIQEAAHPFYATQVMASPLIDLQLIDVTYFSILQGSDSEPA